MAKLPDSKTIRELADLLNDTDLTEIEVENAGMRIRVTRQGEQTVNVASAAPAQSIAAPAVEAPAAPAIEASDSDNPNALKSPMVGTAYLAAEPGAADFVSVGSKVEKGATVLIIEAMKTMNSVAAPKSGTVTKIIVTNEQPVEFDEVLMVIE
jgi:acetyl-CoA carboxylase biotin carboxyl carrier protein